MGLNASNMASMHPVLHSLIVSISQASITIVHCYYYYYHYYTFVWSAYISEISWDMEKACMLRTPIQLPLTTKSNLLGTIWNESLLFRTIWILNQGIPILFVWLVLRLFDNGTTLDIVSTRNPSLGTQTCVWDRLAVCHWEVVKGVAILLFKAFFRDSYPFCSGLF